MKKLITILTIMIVLVGATFATDSAQITLNATVSERVPSFKLNTTGNTALDSEAAAVVIPDGSGSATIKSTVADALADGTNTTVTFGVVLVPRQDQKKIKTTHTYTFTVTAGDLVHADANSLGTKDVVDANEKFTATKGNFVAVQNAIPAANATVTGGASLVLTFNGKSYDPGNAEFVFATFPVEYSGNASALPGSYSGTVTISIATT